MMILRQGDRGEGVKAFQRGLNKLGAMLLIDGDFGTGTRDAIVDARVTLKSPGPPDTAEDELQALVAAEPDLFPQLTAAGVTFIARAEVSNVSAYKEKYQKPCLPSDQSGITIGIGYDCQFVSRDELQSDWATLLPQATIDRLATVLRQVGTESLLASVGDVVVPLSAAMSVFAKRSPAKSLNETRTIYPQIDDIAPARRAALVSLVYNRGNSLEDKPGRPSRLEMRNIRDLLASGKPNDVADQLDAMAGRWDPVKLAGLVHRRHDEATLWRSGFAALQFE